MECYSKKYKTKTEYIPKKNSINTKDFVIGLDIGYSSVKVYSHYFAGCFPSFVKEIDTNNFIGTYKDTDILYQDEKGKRYVIGEHALAATSANDTNDDINILCSRNRYYSPSFLILARVGIAMAIKKNKYGGKTPGQKIFIETGLPPKFRAIDTPMLIDVLEGSHNFKLKIGNDNWINYSFILNNNNISVTDQPIGSIYSASKSNNGDTINNYIDCNTLVLDGGFGTLDTFYISDRNILLSNTFTDLGMKSILQSVSDKIFKKYNKLIPVHAMQNILKTGETNIYNRRTKQSKKINIIEDLRSSNFEIFEKALDRVETGIDDLDNLNYILVTGGTGDAWLPYIKNRYSDFLGLKIITGNQNEALSQIYSNSRGYFLLKALSLPKL